MTVKEAREFFNSLSKKWDNYAVFIPMPDGTYLEVGNFLPDKIPAIIVSEQED